MIDEFDGKYRFLSNFYPAPVTYEGMDYASVENAYQAAKTTDVEKRKEFQFIKASEAKRKGKVVALRPQWNSMRVNIMHELVLQKFTVYPHLKEMLLATGVEELQEGNWWGDTFWGTVNGVGENWLGRILMQVRRELQ